MTALLQSPAASGTCRRCELAAADAGVADVTKWCSDQGCCADCRCWGDAHFTPMTATDRTLGRDR